MDELNDAGKESIAICAEIRRFRAMTVRQQLMWVSGMPTEEQRKTIGRCADMASGPFSVIADGEVTSI